MIIGVCFIVINCLVVKWLSLVMCVWWYQFIIYLGLGFSLVVMCSIVSVVGMVCIMVLQLCLLSGVIGLLCGLLLCIFVSKVCSVWGDMGWIGQVMVMDNFFFGEGLLQVVGVGVYLYVFVWYMFEWLYLWLLYLGCLVVCDFCYILFVWCRYQVGVLVVFMVFVRIWYVWLR